MNEEICLEYNTEVAIPVKNQLGDGELSELYFIASFDGLPQYTTSAKNFNILIKYKIISLFSAYIPRISLVL